MILKRKIQNTDLTFYLIDFYSNANNQKLKIKKNFE